MLRKKSWGRLSDVLIFCMFLEGEYFMSIKNLGESNLFQVICFTIISVFLLISTNLSAGTSAQIDLSGSVPQYMSLDISANNFDFGDPSADSMSEALVSEVTIYSNAAHGWTLNLSNQNTEFALESSTDSVPYVLMFDGEKIKHANTMILDSDNGSNGATRNLKKDIKVSLRADKELNAGEYKDQLTLEIVAN